MIESLLDQAQLNYDNGKYSRVTRQGNDLNLSAWRSQIAGKSFIYVSTHGTSGIYEMQSGDPFFDGPVSESDSHEGQISPAMGPVGPSTYPPYNATNTPPANIVIIDTCETLLAQNKFIGARYPILNHFASRQHAQDTNSFLFGWKVKLYERDTAAVASELVGQLSAGTPANASVSAALISLNSRGFRDTNGAEFGVNSYASDGDGFAKLIGVYTGTPVTYPWWY